VALIAGSAQFVICSVKILPMVSPDDRTLVTRLSPVVRLYMNAVPPAAMGRYPNARAGGGPRRRHRRRRTARPRRRSQLTNAEVIAAIHRTVRGEAHRHAVKAADTAAALIQRIRAPRRAGTGHDRHVPERPPWIRVEHPPSRRPYGISQTAKSTRPLRKSLRPLVEPFGTKLTVMP
jgi:hypothetical protein